MLTALAETAFHTEGGVAKVNLNQLLVVLAYELCSCISVQPSVSG